MNFVLILKQHAAAAAAVAAVFVWTDTVVVAVVVVPIAFTAVVAAAAVSVSVERMAALAAVYTCVLQINLMKFLHTITQYSTHTQRHLKPHTCAHTQTMPDNTLYLIQNVLIYSF